MNELNFRKQKKLQTSSLFEFVKYFWTELEPVAQFQDGWCMRAICQHLEEVTEGSIKKILINVPPGFAKSLLTNVFWPAWMWGPKDKAHTRFVTFSYAAHLTERDNAKFRDLVRSQKYKELWGERFDLTEDGKVKVANSKTGWKFASSVGGVGTGERGDVIILDDAHNIKDAESEVIREETVRWVKEAMSNRLNNMKEGSIVAIMQRSHSDDVSNLLMDLDYEHLMVPMEYDPSRHCQTSIGWEDPRTEEGELAWPERFPPEVVEDIHKTIGPYAYSSQYQQAPTVRGGAIIKRDYWQAYQTDDGKVPPMSYVIASLDAAYTNKQQNDPSGFTVWGLWYDAHGHAKFMCLNAWRKRLEIHGPTIDREPGETDAAYIKRTQKNWGLVEWIAHSCRRFRVDKLLVEGKGPGHSVAQEIRRLYSHEGWSVQLVDTGHNDKVARAHSVQALFADNMIYLPAYSDGTFRDWGEMLVSECEAFPKGSTDDLVDSTTQALRHFRENNLATRRIEQSYRTEEARKMKHNVVPLYPV